VLGRCTWPRGEGSWPVKPSRDEHRHPRLSTCPLSYDPRLPHVIATSLMITLRPVPFPSPLILSWAINCPPYASFYQSIAPIHSTFSAQFASLFPVPSSLLHFFTACAYSHCWSLSSFTHAFIQITSLNPNQFKFASLPPALLRLYFHGNAGLSFEPTIPLRHACSLSHPLFMTYSPFRGVYESTFSCCPKL